jgi:hypothetical protein
MNPARNQEIIPAIEVAQKNGSAGNNYLQQ